jgi:hypothetical protein
VTHSSFFKQSGKLSFLVNNIQGFFQPHAMILSNDTVYHKHKSKNRNSMLIRTEFEVNINFCFKLGSWFLSVLGSLMICFAEKLTPPF